MLYLNQHRTTCHYSLSVDRNTRQAYQPKSKLNVPSPPPQTKISHTVIKYRLIGVFEKRKIRKRGAGPVWCSSSENRNVDHWSGRK